MAISASSTTNVTVQATGDFVTWTNVGSVILNGGKGSVTNTPAAGATQQFYRAWR